MRPISRGVNKANLVELTSSASHIQTRISNRSDTKQIDSNAVNSNRSSYSRNHTNLIPVKSHNHDLSNATLATVNTRSLKANLDLIKPIIHDLDIDLLCLTETWLRPDDEYIARAFTPPGFTLFREDRSSKPGGGVAVLCQLSLKPKLIQTEQHSTFEHIAISLSPDKSALRLVSLYRPPSSPAPRFLE